MDMYARNVRADSPIQGRGSAKKSAAKCTSDEGRSLGEPQRKDAYEFVPKIHVCSIAN